MNKAFKNEKITRKVFLQKACLFCLGAGLSSYALQSVLRRDAYASGSGLNMREAKYYKKIDEETVQCMLCPRGCTLTQGQRSFCRVREMQDGKLQTLVYGRPCSLAVDPIEKKPFFHFLPGSSVFSLATAGCNFRCKYCQNWQISQSLPEEVNSYSVSPGDIISQARENNCPSIAYTYTDPVIFYEYMLDIAKEAKANGIRNTCHTNGCFRHEPANEIAGYLSAANIDLKSFNQDFYTDVCAGFLQPVLDTLKIFKEHKVWIEITNLLVPTLNDDLGEIQEMCIWIRDNLGRDVPLHFSRFWPQYKLTGLPATPIETLEEAWKLAKDSGLNYAYIGNVPGHPAEHTYCPSCAKPVIKRSGYVVLENNVVNGRCEFCGAGIAGVWD